MKKALIVGGARSGKYIALLLAKNHYQVSLTDINEVEYKDELSSFGISVFDNGHPDFLLDENYDLIIKNPGIKYSTAFIQKLLKLKYKIYNEIEIALRFTKNINVFAITGTNGKTTTVSLLYDMLKKSEKKTFLGGNIGIPISEIIYKNSDIKNLIIEVSSFQLDGMCDFKAQYASITNLESDHLDYYANELEYFKSKQKIYLNQDSANFFFLNVDDINIKANLNEINSKIIRYGIDNKSDIEIIDNIVNYRNQQIFNIADLKIVGKHNLYNVILASLMAYVSGVCVENIQEAIRGFKGVEHRIEFVDNIGGVNFYNDSKATNVESLKVALTAFKQPVILIAGGYDKQISFQELVDYNKFVKVAILYGETKNKLSQVFKEHVIVDNLSEAVQLSKTLAQKNDIVLFSPACASFDQFKDFEERGRLFKTYVKDY